MLQMRVYKEIANVEAKVMWGLGWRQLAAAACMLVLGGGEAALFRFSKILFPGVLQGGVF